MKNFILHPFVILLLSTISAFAGTEKINDQYFYRMLSYKKVSVSLIATKEIALVQRDIDGDLKVDSVIILHKNISAIFSKRVGKDFNFLKVIVKNSKSLKKIKYQLTEDRQKYISSKITNFIQALSVKFSGVDRNYPGIADDLSIGTSGNVKRSKVDSSKQVGTDPCKDSPEEISERLTDEGVQILDEETGEDFYAMLEQADASKIDSSKDCSKYGIAISIGTTSKDKDIAHETVDPSSVAASGDNKTAVPQELADSESKGINTPDSTEYVAQAQTSPPPQASPRTQGRADITKFPTEKPAAEESSFLMGAVKQLLDSLAGGEAEAADDSTAVASTVPSGGGSGGGGGMPSSVANPFGNNAAKTFTDDDTKLAANEKQAKKATVDSKSGNNSELVAEQEQDGKSVLRKSEGPTFKKGSDTLVAMTRINDGTSVGSIGPAKKSGPTTVFGGSSAQGMAAAKAVDSTGSSVTTAPLKSPAVAAKNRVSSSPVTLSKSSGGASKSAFGGNRVSKGKSTARGSSGTASSGGSLGGGERGKREPATRGYSKASKVGSESGVSYNSGSRSSSRSRRGRSSRGFSGRSSSYDDPGTKVKRSKNAIKSKFAEVKKTKSNPLELVTNKVVEIDSDVEGISAVEGSLERVISSTFEQKEEKKKGAPVGYIFIVAVVGLIGVGGYLLKKHKK